MKTSQIETAIMALPLVKDAFVGFLAFEYAKKLKAVASSHIGMDEIAIFSCAPVK